MGGEVTCQEILAKYDDFGTEEVIVEIGHTAHVPEDIPDNNEDIYEHGDNVHSSCSFP